MSLLALPFCDGVHVVYARWLGIPGLALVWHSSAFSDDFFSPFTSLLARVLYSTQKECLSPCLLSPHCIFVLFLPPPQNIILFFIYSDPIYPSYCSS